MKRVPVAIVSLFILCALASCGKPPGPPPASHTSPSPSKSLKASAAPPITDEEAIRDAGLSSEAVALIRKETAEPFERLMGFDDDSRETAAQGTVVKVGAEGAEKVALKLRPGLLKNGCLSYVTDVLGADAEKITVVKGTDQYEILKIKKTDGVNYNHNNAEILAKLKDWESRCSFEVLGASGDWVELRLVSLPADCEGFAKEVYQFCPDIVDQGVGSFDALLAEMKKNRKLFLWWD